MFTVFPSLLFLGPQFAPLVLRIVVGSMFIYFAYQLVRHARHNLSTNTPFTWYIIVAETVIGASLLVGAWTQIGAILGVLLSLKLTYFVSRKEYIAPAGYLTYILIVAICLSLLVTGAGAFAFDLPL